METDKNPENKPITIAYAFKFHSTDNGHNLSNVEGNYWFNGENITLTRTNVLMKIGENFKKMENSLKNFMKNIRTKFWKHDDSFEDDDDF